MQGGTVEAAIVVASPRDLAAGWSYTALSRARNETRLLVYDLRTSGERDEFAPGDRGPTATRSDLLARVARRMLERDDEDLAINQLPAACRASDLEVSDAGRLPADAHQEHSAARAEPTPVAAASPARLQELRETIDKLRSQLEALPTRKLQRIDDLDARLITLRTQRERLAQNLAELPEPRRRFGHQEDTHATERAHLTSALEAGERELGTALTQRNRLEHELGDPGEIRSERDGLKRALAESVRELTDIRNDLTEQELKTPNSWVLDTFGERPDEQHARTAWESGVREAAGYRVQYDITDSSYPLGPRPESREQQRDWERAIKATERSERQLGRGTATERDLGHGIEM
jgi:chromosome segregation ATPase